MDFIKLVKTFSKSIFSTWDFFCSQNKCNIPCKPKEHGFPSNCMPSSPGESPSRLRALCGHSGWVFLSGSHYPTRAENGNVFHLTISKCISWHHLVRTRHSRSCLLAPALPQLLYYSKPQKISSHYSINKRAPTPQKKSSSHMMQKGYRKSGVGGERLPQTPSPRRRWSSVKAETHRSR